MDLAMPLPFFRLLAEEPAPDAGDRPDVVPNPTMGGLADGSFPKSTYRCVQVVYYDEMAFSVKCPCCDAELQIDPDLRVVLTHKLPEKPREMADIETAFDRFKGEKQRRDDAFSKSVEAEKNRMNVLDRKFDELLKQAKDSPADERPPNPLDSD